LSVVAGNIGLAFSDVVDGLTEGVTAILEISSFQLDTIDTFRPDVAVLLNITPDHLDRYGNSFEKYVASKCRIFENQRKGDVLIYNWDDPVVRRHVDDRLNTEVTKLPFSVESELPQGAFIRRGVMKTVAGGEESEIVPPDSISIRGRHNLYNSLAASLAAKTMGIPTASLRATLRNFKGVEHRLEFVRERNGVSFVNDSKATNVDSVRYALQSFETPIVLLLGGRDKGNDYSSLLDLVKKHVKAIIAIGESAHKVVSAFSTVIPVSVAAGMGQAVEAATRVASPGDVVLLSPACASFDWFQNYEHRGRVFKEAVMKL
jgi:UDP-N-acetylmuramoylalanine--D-glutamate ligase